MTKSPSLLFLPRFFSLFPLRQAVAPYIVVSRNREDRPPLLLPAVPRSRKQVERGQAGGPGSPIDKAADHERGEQRTNASVHRRWIGRNSERRNSDVPNGWEPSGVTGIPPIVRDESLDARATAAYVFPLSAYLSDDGGLTEIARTRSKTAGYSS